jgi:RNA polymerase sigma factor (sigma-70 family)
MEGPVTREGIDEVLLPFLREADEAKSQRLLTELISSIAEPIVKSIVHRNLRAYPVQLGQDAEDVCGEALMRLLARLRSLKDSSQDQAVENFRSYVAATAFRACYGHLRKKYPRRHSLKNKVRYVLTHRRGLALWETGESQWLCGIETWRSGKREAAQASRLRELRDNPHVLGEAATSADQRHLADLLTAILKWVGAPVALDEIVTLVAELWGIKDLPLQDRATQEGGANRPGHIQPFDADEEVHHRTYLRRLWSEICDLPPLQRAALLLNLRDGEGRGVIGLFPATGIAGIRQIAAVLDIEAGRFAEMWKGLPIEDAEIARLLGVTRQQVINLRKSARQRLARRMKAMGF